MPKAIAAAGTAILRHRILPRRTAHRAATVRVSAAAAAPVPRLISAAVRARARVRPQHRRAVQVQARPRHTIPAQATVMAPDRLGATTIAKAIVQEKAT